MKLQSWYAPLIITTVFFTLFFIFFAPIYETNDDVFFTLIANGYYTKTPTPYFQINPIFQTIHIFVGQLLVWLYTIMPGLNWYSYLMYFIGFISLYFLLYVVFKRVKNRLFTILLSSFILIFVIRIFLFLSFTSIAAMASISGIFLYIQTAQEEEKNKVFLNIVALLMLFTSQFIRQTSFIMIVFLSLPLLVHHYVADKKNSRRLLLLGLFFVTSVIFTSYSNVSIYKANHQWKKSMEFVMPLGQFFYGPTIYNYDNNKNLYENIGWTKNDYQMLNYFYYDNEKFFTSKNLYTVVSSAVKPTIDVEFVGKTLISFIITFLNLFQFVLLYMLMCAIVWAHIKSKEKLFLQFSILLTLLAILYFSYKGYLPTRVSLSMIFFMVSSFVFFIPKDFSLSYKNSYSKSFFLLITMISLCVVVFMQLIQVSNLNIRKNIYVNKIISQIPEGKASLTLVWGSSIPYEWLNVFEDAKNLKSRNFLIGSWTQRTPLNDSVKARVNINELDSAVLNRQVYLILNEYQKELLRTYMKEHYNKYIIFEKKANFSMYEFPSELVTISAVNP